MKAVIQRVKSSSVKVDGEVVGAVEHGYLVLLGVMDGDTKAHAQMMANKTSALRIFCDEDDKMNRSILDVDGEVLCISQFTLAADTKKGNRPSFINAMGPETACEYYDIFCEELLNNGIKKVDKGVFGADMKVSLVNDGPVTIILDTDVWKRK